MYLVIKADETITFEEGKPSFDTIQEIVAGYFTVVPIREVFNDKKVSATLYCNEEGRRLNLPPNLHATYIAARRLLPGDGLFGDVVLTGPPINGGDTPLSENWRPYIAQVIKDIQLIKDNFKTLVGNAND